MNRTGVMGPHFFGVVLTCLDQPPENGLSTFEGLSSRGCALLTSSTQRWNTES